MTVGTDSTEKTLYLLTCFDTKGDETERLVEADSRNKAMSHVAKLNKASAADVARVLGAGGKVEQAAE